MCEIGKPLEILDVEPLNLSAPLRREQEPPAHPPATIEDPVPATIVERVTVTAEKSLAPAACGRRRTI